MKRIKRDPRIGVYLDPDCGSWGVRLKKGSRVVAWNDLQPYERDKVLNHMSFVLKVLKNE